MNVNQIFKKVQEARVASLAIVQLQCTAIGKLEYIRMEIWQQSSLLSKMNQRFKGG